MEGFNSTDIMFIAEIDMTADNWIPQEGLTYLKPNPSINFYYYSIFFVSLGHILSLTSCLLLSDNAIFRRENIVFSPSIIILRNITHTWILKNLIDHTFC